MTSRYDFIIVGAGSAGAALAGRLSADSANRVLLIEAGAASHPLAHIPGALHSIMKSGAANWGYTVGMGPGAGNRHTPYARGKLLGGSSAINGMIYVRGAARDYDEWAEAGNDGWSYENVLPYFKRTEQYSGPTSPYRGTEGPMPVSRPIRLNPMTEAWIEAGVELGIPFNPDTNGPQPDGIGIADFTIRSGVRSNTARAYLKGKQPNLTIVSNAHVTSILFEGKRAEGVSYRRKGEQHNVFAEREVILAGGALNSPQLLMLSGIGDADALQTLGIASRVDLKGVGGNLQDHPAIHVQITSREPISLYSSMTPFGMIKAGLRYGLFRSGPIANGGFEGIAFLQSRDGLEQFDVHSHFIPMLFTNEGQSITHRHGAMASICLSRPASRGRVSLASADPFTAPVVDMNFLDAPEDLRSMREGTKMMRELFRQPAYARFYDSEIAPGPDCVSDADIDRFLKNNVGPTFHASGTCKMGQDTDSVVDDRLRVHGVDNLRVVDASIMPTLVGGNTNAPAIMIGEKAADLILGNRAT